MRSRRGEKHAVRTVRRIKVKGKVVGYEVGVEYKSGAPRFGKCFADGCDAKATDETLIGLQFCRDHFARFYSTERFALSVPE